MRSRWSTALRRPWHKLRGLTKRTFLVVFVVTFVVLGAVRLVLPSALRSYVNHVLDTAPAHRGVIEDLDVNLWRGAYEIEGLRIDKRDRADADPEEPLFEAARVDLAVDWSELFAGKIVGQIDFYEPVVNFVIAHGEEQTGEEVDWGERIRGLFPFRIERLTVRDGSIRFVSVLADPPVDAWIDDLWSETRGVTNRAALSNGQTGAVLELAGRPFGTGELVGRLAFDPTAPSLEFELDLAIQRVPLVALNDFLQAWADFDVEKGWMAVYVELAATGGRVEGYLKLLLEDVTVASLDEIDSAGEALGFVWESIVGATAEILENQPYDRLATKVPIRGSLKDPQADMWETITELLTNAFVRSLGPGLDVGEGQGDLPLQSESDEEPAAKPGPSR